MSTADLILSVAPAFKRRPEGSQKVVRSLSTSPLRTGRAAPSKGQRHLHTVTQGSHHGFPSLLADRQDDPLGKFPDLIAGAQHEPAPLAMVFGLRRV